MSKFRFKNIFLSSKTLRNELRVAFGLIIISILVFIGYLFPGISASMFQAREWLPMIILIVLFIVSVGFLIILQIVEPIIKITNEAKMIANGDLERKIEMAREDEIGELGSALNQMTQRIKDNVEELQVFSKKTEMVNTEINRRILILSRLVEISNLIAQNADLPLILKVGVEKCLDFAGMTLGCLVLKDLNTGEFKFHQFSGEATEKLTERGMTDKPVKLGQGLVGKTILRQSVTIIDHNTPITPEIAEFKEQFGVNGAILAPVTSQGNVFGLLIAANNDPEFVCSPTDKEVFHLISKQIAIAVTNDLLIHEIEKLEVTDHLTGLFNNTFTRKRLMEEIKRAMSLQKPCSFVLFGLDQFDDYLKDFGHIAAENILIRVGNVFKESIAASDKASRFGDHEFALILPEKNKKESMKVSEEIRRKIEELFGKEEDPRKHLTCTAVITENPIDGMTADELILKSGVMLNEATHQGGNCVLS